MQWGISDTIIDRLREVFAKYPEVERVVIFGSRARGDNKCNSDIDIAIFAEGGISGALYADIDEAVGIYKVDVVDISVLNNNRLRKNIDGQGVEMYSAKNASRSLDTLL